MFADREIARRPAPEFDVQALNDNEHVSLKRRPSRDEARKRRCSRTGYVMPARFLRCRIRRKQMLRNTKVQMLFVLVAGALFGYAVASGKLRPTSGCPATAR